MCDLSAGVEAGDGEVRAEAGHVGEDDAGAGRGLPRHNLQHEHLAEVSTYLREVPVPGEGRY